MSKRFLLEEIRELIGDDRDKFHDHVIVGADSSVHGEPLGVAIKVQASPFMALGMIDMLIEKLTEARKEVFDQIKQIEKASRKIEESIAGDETIDLKKFGELFDNLSKDDKEFFDKIHARMLEALMKRDETAMKAIVKELQDYAKNKKGNKGGGFDINDFKNGF
jgi:hypothetical protein